MNNVVARMRPWLGKGGIASFWTDKLGQPQVSKTQAVLFKEEWEQIDAAVLKGFHTTCSDIKLPAVDIDCFETAMIEVEEKFANRSYGLVGTPLQIIWHDFSISERALEIGRNCGRLPLDLTLVESSGRRLGDAVAKIVAEATTKSKLAIGLFPTAVQRPAALSFDGPFSRAFTAVCSYAVFEGERIVRGVK